MVHAGVAAATPVGCEQCPSSCVVTGDHMAYYEPTIANASKGDAYGFKDTSGLVGMFNVGMLWSHIGIMYSQTRVVHDTQDVNNVSLHRGDNDYTGSISGTHLHDYYLWQGWPGLIATNPQSPIYVPQQTLGDLGNPAHFFNPFATPIKTGSYSDIQCDDYGNCWSARDGIYNYGGNYYGYTALVKLYAGTSEQGAAQAAVDWEGARATWLRDTHTVYSSYNSNYSWTEGEGPAYANGWSSIDGSIHDDYCDGIGGSQTTSTLLQDYVPPGHIGYSLYSKYDIDAAFSDGGAGCSEIMAKATQQVGGLHAIVPTTPPKELSALTLLNARALAYDTLARPMISASGLHLLYGSDRLDRIAWSFVDQFINCFASRQTGGCKIINPEYVFQSRRSLGLSNANRYFYLGSFWTDWGLPEIHAAWTVSPDSILLSGGRFVTNDSTTSGIALYTVAQLLGMPGMPGWISASDWTVADLPNASAYVNTSDTDTSTLANGQPKFDWAHFNAGPWHGQRMVPPNHQYGTYVYTEYGYCYTAPTTYCGDYSCNGGETQWSCPGDCGYPQYCGDGLCNSAAEDQWNCPSDCGSSCGPNQFCDVSQW